MEKGQEYGTVNAGFTTKIEAGRLDRKIRWVDRMSTLNRKMGQLVGKERLNRKRRWQDIIMR